MDKIIRIDMNTLKISEEKVPAKYKKFGGRGITSKIIADEVEPTCNPIGKHNKIVFAPGLLGGTMLSSSDRLSVGAKSPLTGRIKEANSGGTAGRKLAKLGIKALIIEGKPRDDNCYVVNITSDEVKLEERNDLKGMGNYKVAKKLYDGSYKTAIISIGQAGEMKMAASAISVSDLRGEPNNVAARGGLGAVMGSKGIKAIVVNDRKAKGVKFNDEESFRELAKEFNQALINNPGKQNQGKYGTASITKTVNDLGALPTKNFSLGSFEDIENIDGDKLYDIIISRSGEGRNSFSCMPGCVIKCRNTYADENGKRITSCLQYETIGLCGSNLGMNNLDDVAKINHLCNDIGLDSIEMGATIGILNDIGMFEFGDVEKAAELLSEISKGTYLGRIIGQGVEMTAKVFGIDRVPAVKGQAMPSYDPRGLKGNGVTYSTSPMSADHTAGNCYGARNEVDPLGTEGQIELSRGLQVKMAGVVDNTGLCLFARPPVINNFEFLADIINKRYGWDLKADDITEIGEEILKTEIEFNEKAGFSKDADEVPEFLRDEKLPPHNTVFDISTDELKKVHNL